MKIIVICTGNTLSTVKRRGPLKAKYPDYEIYSAGTKPEEIVNPYAVKQWLKKGMI